METRKVKHMPFKLAASTLLGIDPGKYRSKQSLVDTECAPVAAKLIREWNESGQEDYSFYASDEYVRDLIICYDVVTKRSIHGFMQYAATQFEDPTQLRIFEDYNGCGFATADLLLNDYKNVYYYNDDEKQLGYLKTTLETCKIRRRPKRWRRRTGSFDVVISLETAEHFKEPFPYVKGLVDMLRPGGLFVYSHCFVARPVSPRSLSKKDEMTEDYCFAGHFTNYLLDGEVVSGQKMARKIAGFVRENFTQVFKGFNGKPTIFRKNGGPDVDA